MSEKPEVPEPPKGSAYAFFKKPGERTWSLNIVLPDGHKEIMDTGQTDRQKAMGAGNSRVRMLYKERGIESPHAYKVRTGCTLDVQAIRRAMLSGELASLPSRFPDRFPGGAGALPAGPPPITNGVAAEADTGWTEAVAKIEDRFAKAFYRIQGLMLIGGADDPLQFREHVRAIVIEATMGAMSKPPRAPYGSKKRGPYKPRESR